MVFVSGKVEIEGVDAGLAEADVEDAVLCDARLDGDRITCKGFGQLDVPSFEADPAALLDAPDDGTLRIGNRRQLIGVGARARLVAACRGFKPKRLMGPLEIVGLAPGREGGLNLLEARKAAPPDDLAGERAVEAL